MARHAQFRFCRWDGLVGFFGRDGTLAVVREEQPAAGGLVTAPGPRDVARDDQGASGRRRSGPGERARRRLRALFIGVGILAVAFAAVAVLTLSIVRSGAETIAKNELTTVTTVTRIRDGVNRHRQLALSHAIAVDPAVMHTLEEAMAEVGQRLEEDVKSYRPLVSDAADEQLLNGVSRAWRAYRAVTVEVIRSSRDNDMERTRAVVESRWDPAFERLIQSLDDWSGLHIAAADASLENAERAYRVGVELIAAALVLILASIAGANRLARRAILAGEQETAQLVDSALVESARASVFQRLADRMTFASGEEDLVLAARATLQRLLDVDRGDLLLLNPSRDRLSVGTAWGANAPDPGSLVESKPAECPGIRRGAVYEAVDLSDELAVHCQAHRATAGSLLCVPMIALNQTVGVIHLERASKFADAETRLAVRTSEQVALALANARLLHTMEGLAMTDPLTGLHNSRFFDPLLDVEMSAAARDHVPLAVLMIDLDNFKKLNDTHGHQAGDQALRTFARTLRTTLRESDAAARYGGEEFVVMLRGTDGDAATKVGEKVRHAVERMAVEVGPGRQIHVTVSIGVASTDQAGHDAMALLRLADRALYRAKQAGRNQVQLADPVMDGGSERPVEAAPDDEGARQASASIAG